MKIIRADHMGFCGGVRRAILMAEAELAKQGELNVLGSLVHNPRLIDQLTQKGLKTLESLEELGAEEKVMIRAHGTGPSVYAKLSEKSVEILDATCPSVKKIFALAEDYSEKGYRILIIGEKEHPEVEAIKEWAGDRGVIVETEDDLKNLEKNEKVAVICQSTLAQEDFDRFLSIIRRIFPVHVVFNTICSATRVRQDAAVAVAKQVDLMLVVGSQQSANTRHLYDLCIQVNKNTFLVGGAADLQAEWFDRAKVVGLTAGASAPDWIIKEVENNVLEKELKVNETEKEESVEVEDQEAAEVVAEGDETVEVEAQEEVEAEAEVEEQEETTEPVEEVEETTEEPATEPEEFDMDSFHLPRYNPGDIIQATVVQVGNDEVLVDVGQKSEGVIPRREFSADSSILPTDVLNVGDVITVMVIRSEDQEGRLTFSKRRADQHQHWIEFGESLDKNEILEGKVLETVKGGLIVDIGVRAFMPASLSELRFTSDLKHLVGQTVRVHLIELEPEKRRAIVNRKSVLEEEAKEKREAFWANTVEGDVVHGIVRRITKFGAFVDLGGVDGLLHISDLEYFRVNDPSDVVSIDEELDLKVLKLDPESGRISLGLKQMKMEPWEAFAQDHAADEEIQGTVVRITPWGAFVNVRPGIDGLIHISELTDYRVEKVEDVVNVGQEVTAKILDIDLVRKRLSLSLRAMLYTEEYEDDYEDEYEDDYEEEYEEEYDENVQVAYDDGGGTGLLEEVAGLEQLAESLEAAASEEAEEVEESEETEVEPEEDPELN